MAWSRNTLEEGDWWSLKGYRSYVTPALHYGAAVFEGIRAYQTDKGPQSFACVNTPSV